MSLTWMPRVNALAPSCLCIKAAVAKNPGRCATAAVAAAVPLTATGAFSMPPPKPASAVVLLRPVIAAAELAGDPRGRNCMGLRASSCAIAGEATAVVECERNLADVGLRKAAELLLLLVGAAVAAAAAVLGVAADAPISCIRVLITSAAGALCKGHAQRRTADKYSLPMFARWVPL